MVINQPFAIGDILFIQPICAHYRAVLPVWDHLTWIGKYLPDVRVIGASEAKKFFNPDDAHRRGDYLPLRFASQLLRGYDLHDHHDYENMMLDKYRYCGLSEDLWKTLKFAPNIQRGRDLRDEVTPEKYILVNNHCQAGKIAITPETDLPIFEMRKIKHFHLLDWWKVISEAEEFHTVSTSTFYMLQAMYNLGMRVPKTFIYPRPNTDGLRGISQLKPDFENVRINRI